MLNDPISIMKHTIVDKGIIDSESNPFTRKPWVEQGLALTSGRQEQLPKLFGKAVENILMIQSENDGRYVAFVAIRWGFACLLNNNLSPTEKWTNRHLYDGHGRSLVRF